MRCHYEVLAVAREASALEIKKAFRLQALRWHPDKHQKNGISSEEATAQFQAVQCAYEVLSDPHEKKWYDEHREQVLRGADGGEEEDADDINLFRYFSASVFSGFGSDDRSFYVVYGDLFSKIDELDVESGDGSRSDTAPEMGDAKSSVDDVNHFYQHWKSYTTQRSFAWVDEYKTTDAPTRLVRRAMEKENKKLRDGAKKAFTSEVRELVDFVCRRDPRVRAMQKQKEKEKAERRVEEETKKREKQAAYEAERRAFQEQQEKMWADSNMETSRVADRDIEQELEKLRKKMDADVLVCDLCSKTFKSTKQLQNHLTSKKHREKEEELGVFSDLSILDDEMDRELQEELIALGKVERVDDTTNDGPAQPPAEDEQNSAEVDAEQQQADDEAARQREEAERVRLEKEQKAADKRKERKEMRKNKKKENVEKIVSSARSKKAKEDEDEDQQRGRGKKGGKKRRG